MTDGIPTNYKALPKIDKKILVAEDLEFNQILVKNILEGWGCDVDIAVNGLEAVKKVKEADYDLVLMDIQMPVMDGITATHEIRNLPYADKANLIIIAFTSVDYKDENKYLAAGMNGYIIKPYTEENLHQKIVNLLKNKRVLNSNSTVGSGTNRGNETGAETGLSAKEEPKLYDTTMIDSIGRNNAAFTSKMIVMFVEVISDDFNSMKLEAAKENWAEVSQLAHKMKSTFGNMGVTSALDDIKALEAGTAEPLAKIEQLEDKLGKVISQMKHDYASLFPN